ncbi:MAG: hypothetical protein WC755_07250, partial [Candidatus Woesearchaeota archaeon]
MLKQIDTKIYNDKLDTKKCKWDIFILFCSCFFLMCIFTVNATVFHDDSHMWIKGNQTLSDLSIAGNDFFEI